MDLNDFSCYCKLLRWFHFMNSSGIRETIDCGLFRAEKWEPLLLSINFKCVQVLFLDIHAFNKPFVYKARIQVYFLT